MNYIARPFRKPRESFPRDDNGLIDLGFYDPYLVDHPDDVPVRIKSTVPGNWIYQHLYFQKPFYMQKDVPQEMRDGALAQFSSSPYNQIGMRAEQEQALHRRMEEHVFPPDPEIIRSALIDFKHLDVLGASAVGRRIALVPEALQYLAPELHLSREASELSPIEKASFFDEELEKALAALETSVVTPRRVITGIIRRLGKLLNHDTLQQEAKDRVRKDSVFYPIRVKNPGVYYIESVEMLRRMHDGIVIPLQTEENQLESAA